MEKTPKRWVPQFFTHSPAPLSSLSLTQPPSQVPQVRMTETSTPAGRSRFMSLSTVAAVGAVMSTRRECVRVSNCSRESLLTCGERRSV